ncbi:leucine-rich repeat-containing protein 58 [Platysternon megacephalum]|uniref:Leucine-rich repeat-containing protein 58 n=1 Tax=Platysternon megacephalum TaxID=55544 RepID=A0A4D9EFE9_9SAUR|nr:leucine-rich repeat-containing protein 58 [Platysternon megacephalum]
MRYWKQTGGQLPLMLYFLTHFKTSGISPIKSLRVNLPFAAPWSQTFLSLWTVLSRLRPLRVLAGCVFPFVFTLLRLSAGRCIYGVNVTGPDTQPQIIKCKSPLVNSQERLCSIS